MPLRLLLLLSLSLPALPSCSVPRVDPARPAVAVKVESRPHYRAGDWPGRPHPTKPSFVVKQGKPPVDEGNFRNCRIFVAGEVKDGAALFVSSRRHVPVSEREEPFTLTVASKKEDNVVELRTRDHRVTLAVIRKARTKKPRGLMIYLASIMLISNEEKAFLRRMQGRGWNVAAITPTIDLFTEDRWEESWSEDKLDQYGSLVAHEIDNYLAETAYATEAILAWLKERKPAMVDGARVVVGASAGALATPALLQRIGGADAVVYVGGGANVPEIVLESSLDIYHPDIQVTSERTTDSKRRRKARAVEQLKKLALERSRIDPLHIGPTLPDVPTLILSAEFDRVVPTHTGDQLYDALGRPERWRYPFGHVILFLGLPLQSDRVADWLEGAIKST